MRSALETKDDNLSADVATVSTVAEILGFDVGAVGVDSTSVEPQ